MPRASCGSKAAVFNTSAERKSATIDPELNTPTSRPGSPRSTSADSRQARPVQGTTFRPAAAASASASREAALMRSPRSTSVPSRSKAIRS